VTKCVLVHPCAKIAVANGQLQALKEEHVTGSEEPMRPFPFAESNNVGLTGLRIIGSLVLVVQSCTACFPAEGCLVHKSDECDDKSPVSCQSGQLVECILSPCGNYWVQSDCILDTPYCVTTSPKNAECASQPNCAATNDCVVLGLCSDGSDGCLADAPGCLASTTCRDYGNCGFDGQGCVATESGCKNSEDCKRRGECELTDGDCTATPESCAASSACASAGFCYAKDGYCTDIAP
jgi:hypothetical protein